VGRGENLVTEAELEGRLGSLIASWESEVVEFKQAGTDFDTNKIGQYVSALANEANLRGSDSAWLVFGVNDKTRQVVGTDYRREPDRLNGLKAQIAQDAEPSTTFREIHELKHADGRVLLLEIPPAPRGIPIAWKGHYYARSGESLAPLTLSKLDEIRGQGVREDWSAAVVPGASLLDLDAEAVAVARESFAKKGRAGVAPDVVRAWSLAEFAERARLTRDGQLTRAALLLLGRAESAWRLSPHPAQLTWSLQGQESAYEHFYPPLLLSTTRLYQRIRNVQIRLLPPEQLLPVEVAKYDQQSVLEALHNCIAHQDYGLGARVIVTERPDLLVFENAGSFFEGLPDEYVQTDKVPRRYRNPCLVQTMAELNMIDTMGYGIRRMATSQAGRYLPLPDYDLSEPDMVRLTMYGGVVDPAYTRMLMQRTDLPLADVLALDRVQKKLPVPDDVVRRLRSAKLVEGRRPHLHVTADVAAATGNKADYIRTRAQDDAHYSALVLDYLRQYGSASRREIDELLGRYLNEVLSPKQQRDKVTNLLAKMRRAGQIRNAGTRPKPKWQLS